VCVSGAGPSLLAFETDDGGAVDAAVASAPGRWDVLRPGLRARGFEVLEG
jgi:hypothetical protein